MHACRRCCSHPRLLSHRLARDRWVRHVAGSSGRSDSLPVEELTTSVPSLPVAFAPLGLKYLEEHELRRSFDAYDTNGNGLINAHEARAMLRDAGAEGSLAEAEQAVAAFDAQGRGAISWEELKAAVDVAATPVDGRVRPIYATLTLLFTSYAAQGSNPRLAGRVPDRLLLTHVSALPGTGKGRSSPCCRSWRGASISARRTWGCSP